MVATAGSPLPEVPPPVVAEVAGDGAAGSDEAGATGAVLPGLVLETSFAESHAAVRSVEASPAAKARTARCRITELPFFLDHHPLAPLVRRATPALSAADVT
jgi:hypothetical protein